MSRYLAILTSVQLSGYSSHASIMSRYVLIELFWSFLACSATSSHAGAVSKYLDMPGLQLLSLIELFWLVVPLLTMLRLQVNTWPCQVCSSSVWLNCSDHSSLVVPLPAMQGLHINTWPCQDCSSSVWFNCFDRSWLTVHFWPCQDYK